MSPMRHRMWLLLLLGLFAIAVPEDGSAQEVSGRKAFYIASRAQVIDPEEIFVRGVSNLPAKSVLSIRVYDFVGQGSDQKSVEVLATIPKSGFFEASIAAAPGKKFGPNMICDVAFHPFMQKQGSVLAAVGRKGEKLGFPKDPQVDQYSGGYYLSELVHVP